MIRGNDHVDKRFLLTRRLTGPHTKLSGSWPGVRRRLPYTPVNAMMRVHFADFAPLGRP